VNKTEDGLEALIFTAEGDMRQAINNLQATVSGFGLVNSENVFKVCDQPHPLILKMMVSSCLEGDYETAYSQLDDLWAQGYSPLDIVGTLFRVVKQFEMAEYWKLEYLKVRKTVWLPKKRLTTRIIIP
jgi:replication factor C subunit 2/4